MRRDMHKLLCERSRRKDPWADPGDRRTYFRSRDKSVHVDDFVEIDEETGEEKVVIDECDKKVARQRTPMTRSGKELSDFLAPLMGWLRKQVGKKWDNVYSQLSEIMPDGVHSDHIKSHIRSWIEEKVFLIDGIAHKKPMYSGDFSPVPKNELYVDPLDNILKWGKGKVSYSRGLHPCYGKLKFQKKVNQNLIELDNGNQYQKIDGIWYFCEKVDEQKKYSYKFGKETFEPVFVKKQLSKKELKSLNLSNDPHDV